MTRLLGATEPRLATEPLRKLTRRRTLGYECARFAEEMLGMELLPWQRWWMLHALEVDDNGDYRYRTVLTLVARQNGKTHLVKAVALWAMFMGRARLVLGAAQSLDIARESWQGAVDLAEGDPELRGEIDAVRRVNGEQELKLTNGTRYRIAAATRSAGRGLSVDLLLLDELREHRSWDAWGALSKTTIARPNALTIGISNAGDDQSVVLNNLRAAALAGTNPSIALFEWSAEDGADIDDRQAWAHANPGLGRTITEQAIASARNTDPPAVFRTEVMCQKVDALDTAVDMPAWRACGDPAATLDAVRDRIAVCVDVAPDGAHVALVAAGVQEGRVRLEVAGAWSSTEQARTGRPGEASLPELLDAIGPQQVAWYPSGPAVALRPVLAKAVPDGAQLIELKGADVPAACMGLAELVESRRVVHPNDPLLNAHIAAAQRLRSGDGWRFARPLGSTGHVSAAYAAAGAALAAQEMPVQTPMPRPMVV